MKHIVTYVCIVCHAGWEAAESDVDAQPELADCRWCGLPGTPRGSYYRAPLHA